MNPKAQEHPAFIRFWDAYNYKTGRKKCADIWKRNNLDAIADQIIGAIPAYDEFLGRKENNWLNKKHPYTWLYNECWDDEYPAPKQTNTTRDAAERWIHGPESQDSDFRNDQLLFFVEGSRH